MRVHLLTIGDELLDGMITDGNAAWLGQAVSDLGLSIEASRTERDQPDRLIAAFKSLSQHADVLICSGGLGPTDDDLTIECLAAAAGVERAFDAASWADIERVYGERTPPASNRQQVMIPVGGEALRTQVGTAPAVCLEINGCTVYALPGVPREMRWHFERYVAPYLLASAGPERRHIEVRAFVLIGESTLAERVDALDLPSSISVAYVARMDGVLVKLSGLDADAVRAAAMRLEGIDPQRCLGEQLDLASHVLAAFQRAGKTLGAAESCTGGLVGATLTDVPGASAAFNGSIVSYANAVKRDVLGVSESILSTYGAVSEACATAMAEGARRVLAVDVAVSITGIAGPGGGTPNKPVGTICFGWATAGASGAHTMQISGGRDRVRGRAVGIALYRAWRCLDA